MKTFSTLFLLLAISVTAFANVAMPGYWNVGAGRSFTPYFSTDSMYAQSIQMQSELITIHLYKGFAAVRGEYHFINHADSALTLKVGYPMQGRVPHPEVYNLVFEQLLSLNIMGNGEPISTSSLEKNESGDEEKWAVWDMEFDADTTTSIVVHYLVETNRAHLLKGYDKTSECGFTYILESGEAWKGDIEKGRIFIRLMEGLTPRDVKGALPAKAFRYDQHSLLIWDFEQLNPTPENNIVIRYGEVYNFHIDSALQKAPSYFMALDMDHAAKLTSTADFKPFVKANFKVKPEGGYALFILAGCATLFVGLLIYLSIRGIINFRKKGKKGSQHIH